MGVIADTNVSLQVGSATIAALTSVSWSGIGQEAVEITTFGAPNDYRQLERGLINGGEISFTANYIGDNPTHDSSTSGILYEITNSSTHSTATLTFPDSSSTFTHTAPVILTDCSMDAGGPGEVITISGTLTVSGAPSFDAS